jgi:Tol biopolymer transport system component
MQCPHCSQEHPQDSQFCPNTGRRMVLPAARVSSPASPQRARKPDSDELNQRSTKANRKLPTIAWLGITLGVVCVLVIAVVVVGLVVWGGIQQVAGTPAEVSQPVISGAVTGRIVFVSDRDGNAEIYAMNADGSQQTRLTYSSKDVHNDYPAWSPDGQKIAFVSDRSGNPEIYVMNADGSDPTLLRDIPADAYSSIFYSTGDFRPAWSPDGQKLAFVSALKGEYKICIMNADGSNPACLRDSQVGEIYPSLLMEDSQKYPDMDATGLTWCADGQTLVYSSNRSGSSKIYAINADGSNQSSLSNDGGDFAPDCSVDGLKIVFVSTRNWPAQIYVMNNDGSAQKALTNDKKSACYSPSWSPDGRLIVFQSDRTGNTEIDIMYADGSQQTRLTDNATQDWHPDWSPANVPALAP